MSIKNKIQVSKQQITQNTFTHIKFNFSFLTTNNKFSFDNKNFSDKDKIALLNRMKELSEVNYIQLRGYSKNIGFEMLEPSSLTKQIQYSSQFNDVDFRKDTDKYAVFRLYTNNNPKPARIVGKLVNKVFYILFIDLNHEMYKG